MLAQIEEAKKRPDSRLRARYWLNAGQRERAWAVRISKMLLQSFPLALCGRVFCSAAAFAIHLARATPAAPGVKMLLLRTFSGMLEPRYLLAFYAPRRRVEAGI
jgi:hypothetical protein